MPQRKNWYALITEGGIVLAVGSQRKALLHDAVRGQRVIRVHVSPFVGTDAQGPMAYTAPVPELPAYTAPVVGSPASQVPSSPSEGAP